MEIAVTSTKVIETWTSRGQVYSRLPSGRVVRGKIDERRARWAMAKNLRSTSKLAAPDKRTLPVFQQYELDRHATCTQCEHYGTVGDREVCMRVREKRPNGGFLWHNKGIPRQKKGCNNWER